MESWCTVTMRVDPGERPSVAVDDASNEPYNTSVRMVTERGDEITLWFESVRHVQQWATAVFRETLRYVDAEPVMRPSLVDDENPPTPIDRQRWGVG